MRYFAILYNGKIVPATNVCEGMFYDGIYFTVGSNRFKYDPYCHVEEIECGYRYPFHQVSFYKFKHEYSEWYATDEIKYLLFLNEEEDSDLNYFQSTDFNAGVIYANIDKAMGSMLGSTITSIEKEIKLPKIQVVLKSSGSIQEKETLDVTVDAVLEHFVAVYGECFDIEMRHYNDPIKKQYIVFEAKITRKELVKEMTIAEIEDALGYKIKVVGDN